MTTVEQQVAMDGSPATSDLYNVKNTSDLGLPTAGPFGTIKWQLGPVNEVGINGTTIEDVAEVLIARLRGFQAGPFASRENALAITAFEEGVNWLLQRTRKRQAQGVEGTNRPHAE
jgi:hypothetical protein